jgi:hypothetical protein
MSGYGGLMSLCRKAKGPIDTYCIECNAPAYYWQLLINPRNAKILEELSRQILSAHKKWPNAHINIAVCDDWFPMESLKLLEALWNLIVNICSSINPKGAADLGLALLLPFVGRLSSCIQGSVVPHVKKGGLCVYVDWRDDFRRYLGKLLSMFNASQDLPMNSKHDVVFGDARTLKIAKRKFNAMFTSPPYPNREDYMKIFWPENVFISHLANCGYEVKATQQSRLIGSNDVSEIENIKKHQPDEISSNSAKDFLFFIRDYKGPLKAMNANAVYYLPYYSNYFYNLEKAYENIAHWLENRFEGYIIVVNNTARKRIIPVADFVMETWQRLGFKTEIGQEKEVTHYGGVNPRVKGISARHMEYAIKVYR